MKYEIIENKEGFRRITTVDERWYEKEGKFYPSVTWIAGYYPKGIAFYKWLAQKGWDEAQAIKQAAGDKGSKVHQAIEKLIGGETVKIDDKLINPETGEKEEITAEEYECIMSFSDWFKEVKPKILKKEFTIFNEQYHFAGTVDFLCEIGGVVWLIDFKTSQSIWTEYEIQVSAYSSSVPEAQKLGILQLGYKRNKKKYKFTEISNKFNLFLTAREVWQEECSKIVPLQKDYPLTIKL